jgi:hypothetical protein
MMPPGSRHTIHAHRHHFGWDNAYEPVLTVAPGETARFETVDASGGQLTARATVDDVGALDFARIKPVTGPVRIDADQFEEPALHLWRYDPASLAPALYGPGGRVHRSSPSAARSAWRWPSAARTRSSRRAGSAATWMSATSRPGPSSTSRSRSRAPLFSVGDTTPPRATARSAARRSRAR